MRIERVKTIPLSVPLRQPFETSFGRFDRRELLYVDLVTTDGRAFGECPVFGPHYSAETVATAQHIIEAYIAPAVVGRPIDSIEAYVAAVSGIRGHEMAKSAVEHALWSLLAQADGLPLHRLLGGTKEEVAVGVSLGVEPRVERLLERIEQALERGYRRVKIKIRRGWDAQIVEQVRHRFPDIRLMVDANAAYSLDDVALFKRLDGYGLVMIEQPLGYSDLHRHALLQRQVKTPICLDESIRGLADLEAATALGSCRIVNIKPFRVGGLYETRRMGQYCAGHGLHAWCGGMVETGLGRAINLAAASLPGFDLDNDIAPTLDRFVEDGIDPPLEMTATGTIRLSDRPGIGYAVRAGFIDRYRVR